MQQPEKPEPAPNYECRTLDTEDWFQLHSFNHGGAVRNYAEHLYDNCDGWEYMPGCSTVIEVRMIGEELVKTFEVTVDFSPNFHAYEKEAAHEPTPVPDQG